MGTPAESERLIASIMDDRVHGADWISTRALKAIREIVDSTQAETGEELIRALKDAAIRIAAARPSMAPVTNNLARLLHEMPRGVADLDSLRRSVAIKVLELMGAQRRRKAEAVRNAAEILEDHGVIITLSDSSTVREVLASPQGHRVIVAESRPLLEGRRMAADLAKRGLDVTLIVDAAVASFADESDAALVGADGVLEDGSFVNKVGTRPLALAARDSGIPFYVACDSYKFDVRGLLGEPAVLVEREPEEVASGLTGVEVRNPYFEVTSGHLVSGFITEEGLIEPGEVRARMAGMEEVVRGFLCGQP
jgi:eIF-2B alpha/beta/delta-like uncharacterized protein